MAKMAEYLFTTASLEDREGVNDATGTAVVFEQSKSPAFIYSAHLDGATAKIESGVDFTNETTLSIYVWFVPGEGTGWLFGQHNGTNGLGVEQTQTGKMRLVVNGTNGTEFDVYPGYMHTLCISYDTGTATTYLNGSDASAGVIQTVTWPAVPLVFGGLDGGSNLPCEILQVVLFDDPTDADTAALQAITQNGADTIESGGGVFTSDSFVTDPLPALGEKYGTTGGFTVAYDSPNEALTVGNHTAGGVNSFYRLESLTAGKLWTFEVDMEITVDPGNRDHIGICLAPTLSDYPTYRYTSLDRTGNVYPAKFSSLSVNPALQYNPSYFNVGSVIVQNPGLHTWRFIYSAPYVFIWVDNVFQTVHKIDDADAGLDFWPALHVYYSTIRVDEIRFWSGASNLGDLTGIDGQTFPFEEFREYESSAVAADGWSRAPLSARVVNSWTGTADPAINYPQPLDTPDNSITESRLKQFPEVYKRPVDGLFFGPLAGPTDAVGMARIARLSDQLHGGAASNLTKVGGVQLRERVGFLEGYTTDKDGLPVSRRVRLHERRTGRLVQETWSNASGFYRFYDVNTLREYYVVGMDYTGEYNAVIADRAIPEAIP